jgi:TPR repeat protein
VEAAKWFLKSAELGFFQAKFDLGRMYYLGEGVPRDLVRAHMWFNLAGYGVYTQGLEETMTPEQIAEAKELARNWKPK